MSDQQAKLVNGYHRIDSLGPGAFGSKERTDQIHVGRKAAPRFILLQTINRPDLIRRFQAGTRIVVQLEHPHTVPPFDFRLGRDGADLVMRHPHGGSPETRLKVSPLQPLDSHSLMRHFGAALYGAHRRGIFHRDLKTVRPLFFISSRFPCRIYSSLERLCENRLPRTATAMLL